MAKIPTKLPKRIADLMSDMDWFFDLQHWDRSVDIKKEEYQNRICDVIITEEYNQVHMNIYPVFWGKSRKDQRAALLHEYVHTLLIRLQDQAMKPINGEFTNKAGVMEATEKATVSVTERLDRLLSGKSRFIGKAYQKFIK